MKKIYPKIFLIISTLLLTINLEAEMFDFILPHYVKVDKVIPLYEDKIYYHNTKHCVPVQVKEKTSCTKDSVLYPKYISGLDKDQSSEFYEKHLNTVFFDETNNDCFVFKEFENCKEIAQKDYVPVITSYENIAYSNGKKYIKYSKKPLLFINSRSKHFF